MKALSRSLVFLVLALALAAPAAPARADSGSYGYFRVVEGAVTLTSPGSDVGPDPKAEAGEVNQPVLAGDRVAVPPHGKAEIVLADRNILRIDGGSELVLERLAGSADRDDRGTVIRLLVGNLQLVVTPDSLGDELPRVDTPNAAALPQDYGVYRVTASDGWSQLLVRRGVAELAADNGRSTVRADEEAVVDSRASQDAEQAPAAVEAGGFDSLERWARQLDDEAAAADQPAVDDTLRYAASPLNRYGDWIDYEGTSYWRPRMAAGWRPYSQGRWVYLPSGLTWVSSEPWGWIPYHYGSWDYLPERGWAWRPGYVFAPAWVYWYWGPSYVGWCPTGFYTRYYAGQFGADFGFRDGVYGWAGGDWGSFDQWSFVSAEYFGFDAGYRDGYRNGYWTGYWDGRRDVRRYAVPAGSGGHRPPLERGLITTYTKPLRPNTWKDPGSVAGALRNGRGTFSDLPDVTPFIARKPKPSLPPAVVGAVRADNPNALDGTAFRPGTLGAPPPPRAQRPPRTPQAAGGEGVGGAVVPGKPGGRPVFVPGTPGSAGTPGRPDKQMPREVPGAGRPDAQAGGGAPNPRRGGTAPGSSPGTFRPAGPGASPDNPQPRTAPPSRPTPPPAVERPVRQERPQAPERPREPPREQPREQPRSEPTKEHEKPPKETKPPLRG